MLEAYDLASQSHRHVPEDPSEEPGRATFSQVLVDNLALHPPGQCNLDYINQSVSSFVARGSRRYLH